MAHTPGPWTMDGDDVVTCFVDDRIAVRTGDTSRTADIRLIAAAPELLEACKQLVMQLSYVAKDCHELAAIQDGKAAIAKAEGQQPQES